jgi:hypothetical protein
MSSRETSLYIQDYSPKSFVVRGDTQKYKETLKNLGGKWGTNFTDKQTGEKFGAWLYWNAKKSEIEEWLKTGTRITEKQNIIPKNINIQTSNSIKRLEMMEMMIIDIVEVLENIDTKETEKLKSNEFYLWYKKENENKYDLEDCEEVIEEENVKPHRRLLKK